MIKIDNVNKYFNKNKKNEIHVINNVNLTLGDNGLVAILGQSGSGKTTLLNAIGGLDKVGKGNIYVNDQKMTSKFASKVDKIRTLNIGYVFQDYKLVENLTVFENLEIALKMVGIKDKNEIKVRIDYILKSVNMYRYRNRPAEMLSGGERQRVGIARALVTNPDIIIADEPTGNLDSKNTIQIMNIIKAISREKLVILVTHEKELAKFYASRIVEIQDGKIKADYENSEIDELDYGLDTKIFLKDLKDHQVIEGQNVKINYYSDDIKNLDIKIVAKNGNIYIQCDDSSRIEILDQNSNIEIVDDHYKKIDKEIYQDYEFNFTDNINTKIKKKYSSIFNPITLILNGFKKVFSYTVLKKILIIGFFISSMFTMYAASTTAATLKVEDKDFVKINKDYLQITNNNKEVSVDKYLQLEKYDGIKYVFPSTSEAGFKFKYDEYYQTSKEEYCLSGSITPLDLLNEQNIIYGKKPENDYEIAIDKICIDKMLESEEVKMAGVLTIDDILNKELFINNMERFKLVGITDEQEPVIYVKENMAINILANSEDVDNYYLYGNVYSSNTETEQNNNDIYIDYKLFEKNIEIKEGKLPENDYEVIVNINNKEQMPLNEELENYKINNKKLKVVGYYKGQIEEGKMLVNNNTIKYNLIEKAKAITIYSTNKEKTIEQISNEKIKIEDSYIATKNKYLEERKEQRIGKFVVSGIILGISLIEIFLITRSSFLSRIKEVGIYRAIGVKKLDIYKMFSGEIIAISTLGSLTGTLFMAYILKVLCGISYTKGMFVINTPLVAGVIVFVYVFNLLAGLLPVFNVIRKRPAEILSRHDLD